MKKLILFFLVIASTCGGAENAWLEAKFASGNWNGARDQLADRGVEPFLFYTNIISGNPVGGRRQGVTYVDDFCFGVNLYLAKLVGWQGAQVTISGVNRDGTGLTDNYVGSRFDVQQTVGGKLRIEEHVADVAVDAGRIPDALVIGAETGITF